MSPDLHTYLLNIPHPQRSELQYLIAKEISSHNSKLIPLYCRFSISKLELGQAVFKNKLIDYLLEQASHELLNQIKQNLLEFVEIEIVDEHYYPTCDQRATVYLKCQILHVDKNRNLSTLSNLNRSDKWKSKKRYYQILNC